MKFGISFTLTHLNQAGALVHVYQDGSVHLNHGGTEMGQGLFQKVAQVAAEEFGIGLERVHITATSTDKVPNTSPTAASSGTDLNGMAVQHGGARNQRRGWRALPARPGTSSEDRISFRDDRVFIGNESIPFGELTKKAHAARVHLSAAGFYKTPKLHWDREKGKGRPFFYYAYGAACSEVVIDILTGEMKVRRVDILHDVGRSMNPAIDIGQIEGAFVQGMGWLTTEELVYDEEGRLLTHAPSTYKIPVAVRRAGGLPRGACSTAAIARTTIYRSKAVGEPPLMLAISVFAAIADAIHSLNPGKPVALDAPATPEAILKAVGPSTPSLHWRGHGIPGRDGMRCKVWRAFGRQSSGTARRAAERDRGRRISAARERRPHRAAARRRLFRHYRRRPPGVRGARRAAAAWRRRPARRRCMTGRWARISANAAADRCPR